MAYVEGQTMKNTTGTVAIAPAIVIALTAAAAAIHFSRAAANSHITVLFALNGLGYLTLLALLYLPLPQLQPRRRQIRWTLICYAALTFVLFFVWGMMKGEWPAIGFVDKVIEATLIGLLWYEAQHGYVQRRYL